MIMQVTTEGSRVAWVVTEEKRGMGEMTTTGEILHEMRAERNK